MFMFNYDAATLDVKMQGYRDNLDDNNMDDLSRLIRLHETAKRVNERLEDIPLFSDYPPEYEVTKAYPGVDPAGKKCFLDMEFGARMNRIQAVVGLMEPEAEPANVWNEVLHKYDELQEHSDFNKELDLLRMNSLARMQTGNPEDMRVLMEENAYIRGGCDTAVHYWDRMLSYMEYKLHLSSEEPPEEEAEALMESIGQSHTLGQYPLSGALSNYNLKSLNMQFSPFEHISDQIFVSELASQPVDLKLRIPDRKAVAVQKMHVAKYCEGTVAATMNALFDKTERESNYAVKRLDLVTIGGKTVREYLGAPVNLKKIGRIGINGFGEAYQDRNIHEDAVNQLVAAGLLAGKKVMVYTPTKDGKGLQSLELTKTGFHPANSEPTALNWFQKLMHKWFGAYKDRVSKAAEEVRVKDADRRVRVTYENCRPHGMSPTSAHVIDGIFGPYRDMRNIGTTKELLEDFSTDYPFQNRWGSLAAIGVCSLLKDGHSLSDILDPNQLKDEKINMAKDMFAKISNITAEGHLPEREEWAIQNITAGVPILNESFKNMDPEHPERGELFCAECTMDACNALYTFMEMHPKQSRNTLHKLARSGADLQTVDSAQLNAMALTELSSRKALARQAACDLSTDMLEGDQINKALVDLACGGLADKVLSDKQTRYPGIPAASLFSERDINALYENMDDVRGRAHGQELIRAAQEPEFRKAMARAVLHGHDKEILKFHYEKPTDRNEYQGKYVMDLDHQSVEFVKENVEHHQEKNELRRESEPNSESLRRDRHMELHKDVKKMIANQPKVPGGIHR